MLGKSLTQFSVDGWGYVLSLLFDLRPNYGGGNEDNGDLLQKVPFRHCCTQCPQPCSRPPPTHTSTGHSWANLGQSLVGVTAPFHCVLVHTRVCFSPVLCKLWQLYGGINGNFLQEGLCHTQVYFTHCKWHLPNSSSLHPFCLI